MRKTPWRARIVELAQQGLSQGEIAYRLDINANTVASVMSAARGLGIDVPRQSHRMISLPVEVRARLDEAAMARGMEGGQLARALIAVILRDHLIDAVLDGDNL